jgi:hypothetical protein
VQCNACRPDPNLGVDVWCQEFFNGGSRSVFKGFRPSPLPQGMILTGLSESLEEVGVLHSPSHSPITAPNGPAGFGLALPSGQGVDQCGVGSVVGSGGTKWYLFTAP